MMPQSWVGRTIGGRYQIEALLGQGGMSAVYRANDPNLRRLVAIKLIHTHLSSDPNFVGRFKEEAAAVARLRHPNIVQVHDFNVDGETYYMVMEYLVGETLQARLKRLNASGRLMPLDMALDLCIQLCEAAGYAHKHELVHRDIKPANIMLNVHGQAILMDFGIVKIIGGDYHTATGATIGTAMYMSPEQIRSERIDDRADIYSLGVTLYEMLSGQPPYLADSALTLMMMVLNDPLPDLGKVRKDVPESLSAVVRKALAKQPAERFQSMAEMAAALRQVQAELVSVPPTFVATLVDEPEIKATAPATIVDRQPEGNVVTASQAHQTEPASPAVDLRQPEGKSSSMATVQELPPEAAPVLATPAAPTTRSRTRLGSRRILLIAVSLLVIFVVAIIALYYVNYGMPPDLKLAPISLPSDPVNAQNAQMVVNLGRWETDSFIEELAYHPDGVLLGTANNREWVRISLYHYYTGIWQVPDGNLQGYLLGHDQWVYDVDFSPDGKLFGSVSEDGSVMLWQVTDRSLVRKIDGARGGLTSLAFSPNNLLLAAGAWDGTVSLWQISNGNLLRTLQGNDYGLRDVDFSPDGILLAAASDDNSILVWRISDGSLVQTLRDHTASVHKIVFSPDGSLLASASEDHSIRVWQVSDGSLLQTMQGHAEGVYDVAFSPDGSLLASGGGDGTLRLWQVSDGALLSTLAEGSEGIKSVAFSPDGHLLISGAADGVVQFWGISEAISRK